MARIDALGEDHFGSRDDHLERDKRCPVPYAGAMTEVNQLDLAEIEARLRARRQELEELTASHHDEARPVEVDQTRVGRLSRMDALQAQAMAQETERRRQLELDRIAAALERIAGGDYGHCLHCGEKIVPERLQFDPTTPLCIACARQGER